MLMLNSTLNLNFDVVKVDVDFNIETSLSWLMIENTAVLVIASETKSVNY
jgi:hypothetical protein